MTMRFGCLNINDRPFFLQECTNPDFVSRTFFLKSYNLKEWLPFFQNASFKKSIKRNLGFLVSRLAVGI